MKVNPLRFTVRPAQSWDDLLAAGEVRARSYGHHLANVHSISREPDEIDRRPDTVVLLARDKQSREAVGTLRIATNKFAPLQIQSSVELPPTIASVPLVEATRFCVTPGCKDPLVKLALMKALYLYCVAGQIQWMVIGARSESLARQYLRLGFTDLFDLPLNVPLAYAGGLEHRVLVFNVTSAERNWHALSHPYYDFIVRSYHSDIEIFTSIDRREVRVDQVLGDGTAQVAVG
ncbi:MAG: N-acyl amino acid synthase FeeM domain-containing protein [Betaproteobacteria bacterium]